MGCDHQEPAWGRAREAGGWLAESLWCQALAVATARVEESEVNLMGRACCDLWGGHVMGRGSCPVP